MPGVFKVMFFHHVFRITQEDIIIIIFEEDEINVPLTLSVFRDKNNNNNYNIYMAP